MENILNNLYSRFFLRDFLGYILSGSILEYYFIQAYAKAECKNAVELFDYTLTMIFVFVFIGYLVGICISSFCNSIEKLIKKIKYGSIENSDIRLLIILSQDENWISQRDRFVSLKEITSKNGISILISFLIGISFDLDLPRLVLIIPIIILLREWYYYIVRQEEFEQSIEEKTKEVLNT